MMSQDFWQDRLFGASEILSAWILVMVLVLGAAIFGIGHEERQFAARPDGFGIGVASASDCASNALNRERCLKVRTVNADLYAN